MHSGYITYDYLASQRNRVTGLHYGLYSVRLSPYEYLLHQYGYQLATLYPDYFVPYFPNFSPITVNRLLPAHLHSSSAAGTLIRYNLDNPASEIGSYKKPTPAWNGMRIRYDGTLFSPIPKRIQRWHDAAIKRRDEHNRRIQRTGARARRALHRLNEVRAGRRQSLAPLDPFYLRNVTDRTAALRQVGGLAAAIAHAKIPTKTLDTQGDYALIQLTFDELDIVGNYLKMTNPSTGEICLEGVSNECRSVEMALSWRNHGLGANPRILT